MTRSTEAIEWGALSARERDALVAEKVMGWTGVVFGYGGIAGGLNAEERRLPVPHYATDIAAAWDVVDEMQRREPGWRFGLLGGDTTYGYKQNVRPLQVDEHRHERFGWNAEFFGHADPRKDYGQRHGEARAWSAPEAICIAALRACGIEVTT